MTQVRCAIVDDEPLAVELLKGYVKKTDFLKLSGAFTNAIDALAAVKKGGIDLVFLDVQMPELNGLELSKLIKEENTNPDRIALPLIIFTTAFEQYAIRGYKVSAIGYLLKPVSYKEFLEAASKAQKILNSLNAASNGEQAQTSDFLFVKSEYKVIKINLADLVYIEGLKDYIKIYVKQEKYPILTLMGMKEAEDKLPKNKFMRVHRSYIVGLDYIQSFEKGRIVIKKTEVGDGITIPIGESYKDTVQSLIKK